jgi:sRNA-binding protein
MSKKCRAEFKAKVEAALDRFTQKYPGAFFPKDSAETRPLRIGIFTILTGQNPDIGRRVVAEALQRYTMKDRYLRALATSAHRFDLDGRICGEVSEAHRDFAIKMLAERQERKLVEAA